MAHKKYVYYVYYGQNGGRYKCANLREVGAYIAYCLREGHNVGAVIRERV